MSAPYRPGTADLIRTSHEQRSVLTISDGVTTWTPTALSGTLTLSEDWSPYGQLSASVGSDFDAATLALMDPRKPISCTLDAGYVHPDGTKDLHTIFTGQLDSRTAKQPSAVMDIQASTAETLTQEARWLGAESWRTFVGVTEAVEWLAGYGTGTVVEITSVLGAAYRPDLVASIPLTPGQPIWDAIAAIALAADVRVYVDIDGVWTVAPKASVASVTSAYLAAGNGGIVDSSDDTLTRDGYYAAAALQFRWRDAGGVDHDVWGVYGSPGAKTYTTTRESPATQAQANAAAQATVKALSTRGDSYVCNGVAVYWLRPGHTVEITLANGTTARHIVRSVTFQFTAGTMTVTTREPSNLGE